MKRIIGFVISFAIIAIVTFLLTERSKMTEAVSAFGIESEPINIIGIIREMLP